MATSILTEEKAEVQKPEFFTKFVFDDLDSAGIRYVLLRGHDELLNAEGDTEIDLLVQPQDMSLLATIFAKKGFVEIPSWGHAPHRFFITFARELGFWIKLDIVLDLYYGRPIRKYRFDLAHACLEYRRKKNIFVLSYEHEFLTLLLHCLLDKGRFDTKHRDRLRFLRNFAAEKMSEQRRIIGLIETYLLPVLDWNFIATCIDDNNWDSLLKKEPQLKRRLFMRSPIQSSFQKIKTISARRLRPILFPLRHHGVSVALLAPDGAGKSTLAQNLVHDKFLRARLIYMGTNVAASTVGLPFSSALSKRVKSVNAEKRRKSVFGITIRALNLANKLLEHWCRCLVARYHLLRGRFVIFDRFVYDSWIQKRKKTPWKRLRHSLFDTACPTPGLVILLDAPGVLLFERKGEHSPEWIDEQRIAYHKLKDKLPQMITVDASQTADEVRKEVTDLIWKEYGLQVRNRS